jgi:hypothetical protein
MKNSLQIPIIVTLFFFALSGCGGGGGGDAPAGDITPPPGNGNLPPGNGGTIPLVPQADTFTWTGNTSLSVTAANGVLANDPDGTIISAADSTTTLGGSVNVTLATGAFVYNPPVGAQNVADTFAYTANGTPVTVTINLAERIWYVDNSRPANGDGTLGNPFNTLAAAASPVSDANDTIFVFTGVPAAPTDAGQNLGITLVAGQKLLGQGLGLRFNGVPLVDARANPPVISNAGLAGAAGDIPVVLLATGTGNEVAGLTIQTDFNEGILALSGSGHNLHDNEFTFPRAPADGREGIRLLNVTGENFVTVNTITGSPRNGIKLTNNEDRAGDPVAATPIVAMVTMSRNIISNSDRDGIAVTLDGTGTAVTLNILTNTIDNSGITQAEEGINIDSLGAANVTAVVSRNIVSNSTQEAIDLGAAGTSAIATFAANNNLSASTLTNFRGNIANAGATFCLELVNNFNAALNSTFQVDNNNGGADGAFRFFEVDNDTLAGRLGPITTVAQGTCAIPLNGAALFVANCAKCHTGNGLGLNTVKELIATDITNTTVAAINLQFGVPGNGSMIQEFAPTGRLQLTQQEITAIAGALLAP